MFQSNKAAAVNDHSAIVKKPLGLKALYNSSGNIPREHRDTGTLGGPERDNRDHRERDRDRDRERERAGTRDLNSGQKFGHSAGQLKRSPSFSTSGSTGNSHHSQHGQPPSKKHKMATLRDVTFADAGKYGSLNDYAFFDKVSSRNGAIDA